MMQLFSSSLPLHIDATRFLLAIWCTISTLEWVANRTLFANEDILSGDVLVLRSGTLFQKPAASLLFAKRSMDVVLGFRICAAILLAACSILTVTAVCLFTIALTSWFITVRTGIGGDGSDQMGYIASIGTLLTILGALRNDSLIAFAGVLLVASQATLSYFVAGLAKLISPTWRNGIALSDILNTYGHGHSAAEAMLIRPKLCFGLCWLVILAETLFPLVLMLPPKTLYVALGASILFHFMTAYFMGLNTFVWAFIATYPSVISLSFIVRKALGLR
jgi:hypothetical protein